MTEILSTEFKQKLRDKTGISQRKTAGELSAKAQKDNTDYNLLEIGHAMTDNILEGLRECRANHNPIFDEDVYCVGYVIGTDPLICTVKRRKFFAFLYLPKPRPNQTVFLYRKSTDTFEKMLWCLPSAARMAQLSSTSCIVPKEYERMQAWSVAFYKGTFWEYIRHEHNIKMPSEHEYFLANRQKLIEAGCKVPQPGFTESFDFSKIHIKNVIDTQEAII